MSAWLLAAVLTLCAPPRALAADAGEGHVVTLYNESNGLPTGEANDVLQTADGYIWVGSYGGLTRYDGTDFVNFSMEGTIPSSSIRTLFEDSRGRLWIGTNDQGVFVLEDDAVTAVQAPEPDSFLCIRDFAEGEDGRLWAASNSGAAEIVDGRLEPCMGVDVEGATVYSVAPDAYGRVWCALNGGRCAVIQDGRQTHVFSSDEFFDGEDIYCTGSGEDGCVYLGSSGSVLAKLTFPTESLETEDIGVELISTQGVTTQNRIRVSGGGDIVVCGTIGACVIHADGSQSLFTDRDRAAAVNSGCVDYEGSVWLASANYGVIKYTRSYFDVSGDAAGLNGVSVNSVVCRDERIYVATDSGVQVFDRDWTPVEDPLAALYQGVRVRQLILDSKDRIWAAAYDGEAPVACYDPEGEGLTSYSVDDGLVSSSARTVYEMADGSIAVGTQEGLNILRDGKVAASYDSGDGLTTSSVLCLLESASGSLLIGSDGGGIYELEGQTITVHSQSEGLNEGVVLRMIPDEGGYFISAGSSLYYWDESGFRRLDNMEKGAGSVFDLFLRDGELWVMQNDGLLAFDRAALLAGGPALSREYSFRHGLSGSLNANTWNFMDEDGRLYISTRSGVSVFGFESVENLLPKGIINGVWVDGTFYPHPQTLELSGDAGRITVGFSALTYTGTSDAAVAYCLEGFDEQTTVAEGQTSGSVSYTNLPGGDYVFRLSVFDPESGERSGNTYSFAIHKQMKIYERVEFIVAVEVAVIACIAGLVALFYRAKIRRSQRRQREYRSIIEQALQTFARTIDAKDAYTNGHSLRVAAYSREIARRMGMDKDQQENIYYMALLHDIGKIGIPDEILQKPGKLTEEEWRVIQTHPAIGGDILKNFTALDGIAEGARYHHERFDGNGYCEHKRGLDIPLVARIIGVADAYDAMSSDRCYRKSLPNDVIAAELRKNSGTQFDPDIAKHMLDMIADGAAPIRL